MLRILLISAAVLPASAAPWSPRRPAPPPLVTAPVAEAPAHPPELAQADTVGVLLERRYGRSARSSAIADYLLYLPPGIEDRGQLWPVVLYLHGRSLRGDDLSLLTRYGLPRYLAEGRALPFIVIAPQLPDGQSWTDVDRLAGILEDILDRYPADRDRVYLTGYSMGGGGVWRMALAHGDLFAAAAPVAALTPEPSVAWARAVAHLPVRVFHGTADESAPFAGAETMVRALRASGADAELERFEGAGHGDLTRVYGDAFLYDWFLAHHRSR